MARLPRLAIAGLPHHVIARARRGQAIFVDDEDRRAYLNALRALAFDRKVALHAYALLDDEVRLLLTPRLPEDLSRAMLSLGRGHAARFNRRHARVGALWEPRFKATVLEAEPFLLTCMRSIEHEPVRRGLVARAEDYRWSSAAHHHGAASDGAILEHALFWSLGNTPFEREAAYMAICQHMSSERDRDLIAHATQKGWALGSARFIAERANQAGRRLVPLKRGRPAQKKTVPN